MKQFKIWAAALLRKWAQSLDGKKPAPLYAINGRLAKRFKIRKLIPRQEIDGRTFTLALRRNITHFEARERIADILKQETIVEAAYELAPLLEFIYAERDSEIRGDFYFITDDQTNL